MIYCILRLASNLPTTVDTTEIDTHFNHRRQCGAHYVIEGIRTTW
jgi:hypothetical protein